jgi:Flp pilus assembly protein TadD
VTGAVVSSDPEALLRTARAHFDKQQWAEAEQSCRQVLEQHPDHVDALGLLGVVLVDGGRVDDAVPVLMRHLAMRPGDRTTLHRLARVHAGRGQPEAAALLLQRASQELTELAIIQNDLAVVLDRLGRADEAMAAADRAVVLAPDFAIAHGNRGYMLLNRERFGDAVDAELLALSHLPHELTEARISVVQTLVQAAIKAGRQAEAESTIRGEIAAGRAELEMMGQLANFLDKAGRPDEALAVRNDLARRTGLRQSGEDEGATAVLVLAGAFGGLAPVRYLLDPEVFTILNFTLLSADQPDAPLGEVDIDSLRRVDVVFSSLADVDHDGGQFEAAAEVCARIGRPVVNPPASIGRTGRHNAAALFGDIPDMIVPEVRYIDRAGLAALTIDAPVLVRTAGSHGGEDLVRIGSDAEKDAFLAKATTDQLMVSPFHHFQSPDGHWRKYRLIFVDRQVFPYHLAIGDHWLVHYWRALMERSEGKKAEEERFLDDWRGVFGERAARAVEEAARRLDLDYGGMDCALTDDGQVLLFEANACILIHLDEDKASFPYKHRHVPKIREAFTRLVKERARPLPLA